MPRDSNGNYSLPAGNPVTTNTPIAITWANGTMSDIGTVLTASLDRSGNGGMLAALKLDAGLVGAPGLTFGAETTLGLYRAAAGDLGVAVGGVKVGSFTGAGLGITGVFVTSGAATFGGNVSFSTGGTAALPAITFTGDTDIGIYRSSANVLGFSASGVERVTIGPINLSNSLVLLNPVGSAAAPSYSFTGDTNTGMSAAVADTLVLSTAGTARLTLAAAGATFAPVLLAPNGDATTPGYGFTNDPNTGFYSIGPDSIGLSIGGTLRLTGSTTSFLSTVPFLASNGATAATPDYSFSGDPNTGFYSPSADEIGFTLGGVGFLVGYRNVPINSQTGSYPTVLTDSGKCIYKPSGGAGETITIPANASVAYPTGTVITVANRGGGVLQAVVTTDTLTLAGVGDVAGVDIADDGLATFLKVATTVWMVSGVGVSET